MKTVKNILNTLTLILAFTGLFSCGTDAPSKSLSAASTAAPALSASATSTPVLKTALLVLDATDLPSCTSANEGSLYYVQADAEFQVCASGAYQAIDLTGPAGKDGVNGVNGVNGTDAPQTIELLSSTGTKLFDLLNDDYSVDFFTDSTVATTFYIAESASTFRKLFCLQNADDATKMNCSFIDSSAGGSLLYADVNCAGSTYMTSTGSGKVFEYINGTRYNMVDPYLNITGAGIYKPNGAAATSTYKSLKSSAGTCTNLGYTASSSVIPAALTTDTYSWTGVSIE